MAEIVGAYAGSHAPLIARDWALFPEPLKARFTAAYRETGRRLLAQRPDVIVAIAPDHWNNFFLNNLPAICLGIGAINDGPPEPFMKSFPHREIAGHAELGRHILATALNSGFEPAHSHRLILDHGFCIPLWRMEIEPLPPVIPVIINDLEPPMMSLARCLQWGELITQAVADYPQPLRVAVVATGGLSHSIGEASMGAIDEPFDRRTIELFGRGDAPELIDFLETGIPQAGNGSHEIRNWLVAHAAMKGRGFELIDYFPCPEVYVGCAWASWTG